MNSNIQQEQNAMIYRAITQDLVHPNMGRGLYPLSPMYNRKAEKATEELSYSVRSSSLLFVPSETLRSTYH